jgi:hypothetical protein
MPRPQQPVLSPSCCTPLCLVTGPAGETPSQPSQPGAAGARAGAQAAGDDDRAANAGVGGAGNGRGAILPPSDQEVRVAGARTSAARGATARVVASLGSRIVVDAPAPIAADAIR